MESDHQARKNGASGSCCQQDDGTNSYGMDNHGFQSSTDNGNDNKEMTLNGNGKEEIGLEGLNYRKLCACEETGKVCSCRNSTTNGKLADRLVVRFESWDNWKCVALSAAKVDSVAAIKRGGVMGKHEKKTQRMDSRTNLVGKFTHSVKRLVKEVADDTAPGGQTKDQAVQTSERLRLASAKLNESYDTAKKALRTLHEGYNNSKSIRNFFRRYVTLKLLIKEVVRLDVQYWLLVEVPKQEKQETVPSYVLRACISLEKSLEVTKSGETQASRQKAEDEVRERQARFLDMTGAAIDTENTQLINDLYRLLKKYTALRNLMKELKQDYHESKSYPIIPRYTMLKDMIKDITRDPDYMEVCHEDPA
ncbi:hypothetical protein CHUAL_003473 [Chamberlinius hualienensis]